jgi:thiol-disulfide isomerase/thioredoxin
MVVLWASWCGPCRMEIPYLKELRSALAQDDLAILAISNESTLILEKFVREQRLNYTVLSNPGTLPAPFGIVQVIPTTFFINYERRFEAAVAGATGAREAKAIAEVLAAGQ